MTDLRTFDEITPADAEAVGGKGLSLGLMARAGLPVPPGFCISSAAQRRLGGQPPAADAGLAEQIGAAYRRLGSGPVAVRSSATAEDGAVTSFAGQQETILGVEGEQAVQEAVGRCWQSLHSERAVAYRRHHGVRDDGLAMAVVVQRLVPAEVAGVLFTRDPLDPTGRRMLVEASWGLGESVVSGKVTPDRYHIDRETGRPLEQHVSAKRVQVVGGREQPVPAEMQERPCLDESKLAALAELGRRVEDFYGEPRDVEWAFAEGRFWLLQARPITAAGAAEREQVRREEIASLQARAEPLTMPSTVWSLYNVPEGMPEPTPMTWALVRRMLSGEGANGMVCRALGAGWQARRLGEGVIDLVAGRPYCNLSRESRQWSNWIPYAYRLEQLRAEPARALAPRPSWDPTRAGPAFWLLLPLRLPFLCVGGFRHLVRMTTLGERIPSRLRQEVFPAFAAQTARAAGEDWSQLSPPALLEKFHFWCRRTLDDFARDSLVASALTGATRTALEGQLIRKLGPERGREAVLELSMGVHPDPGTDLFEALRDLAEGRLDRETFLKHFGHRGPQDMELSQPRWAEDPTALDRQARHRAQARPHRDVDPAAVWEKIATEAGLSALQRSALWPAVQKMRLYTTLRETGKHYFMFGYALIRRALVELDRRFGLQGGIFYLTPEELPRLLAGADMSKEMASRRRRRSVALSLEVPAVLFSDDLEAIGRPLPVEGADNLQGVPLSAGSVEARALVLESPEVDELPAEPFVLVCPSTDPSWMPLFVHAAGLVMESGGVLSHGAIVARESGLPAVAGLPGVQRRLRTGQRLRVDGGRGTVSVLPG
jgi:phosphohistidine swiveling domain-containing protein